MKKTLQIILYRFAIFLLSLFYSFGWGQTTIVSENFENSLSLFTVSGGPDNYYTGNSATSSRPASSPYAVLGTYSYGINNGTRILTSNSNIDTSIYTGVSMSVRLAAFSINSTNGVDTGDIVTIEVSPNGGTNWYSTLRVLGNSNAFWAYSATGNASTSYDGNATPLDFQPSGGGSRTADGYSTLTITGLPSVTNLRFRITLLNNDVNEIWVIDDFKVQGTLAGKTSTGSGDWNNAATWSPVGVPSNTDNVIIQSGHTVFTSTALTRNAVTNVNGTFQLNAGGWASGTNFTYGAGASLNFNNTSSYGVNSGDVFWPTTNGPTNVNVLQGGLTLNAGANRTVTGIFQTAAGVTLNSATLTLSGTGQINAGGFFNNVSCPEKS